MIKDENRIVLKGNVGRDPRVQMVGQSQVVNFSLATKESWKDRNGEWKDETTWFNVVAWQGHGICDFNQIQQGQKLLVVGKMRNREFTDKNSEKRSIWEVVASTIDIIQDIRSTPGNGGENRRNRGASKTEEDNW